MADLIWMEHEETGGKALLPDTLLWRSKGWAPTDKPPSEPDLLHDPEDAPDGTDPRIRPDSTPIDAPDNNPDGDNAGDPQPQPTPVGEEPVPAPKTSKAAKAAANVEES